MTEVIGEPSWSTFTTSAMTSNTRSTMAGATEGDARSQATPALMRTMSMATGEKVPRTRAPAIIHATWPMMTPPATAKGFDLSGPHFARIAMAATPATAGMSSAAPKNLDTPTPTPIPTPTPGPRLAFSQIEAESFDTLSGIQTESCTEGGQNIKIYGYQVTLKANLEATGTGLDQTMFLTFDTAYDIARKSATQAKSPLVHTGIQSKLCVVMSVAQAFARSSVLGSR